MGAMVGVVCRSVEHEGGVVRVTVPGGVRASSTGSNSLAVRWVRVNDGADKALDSCEVRNRREPGRGMQKEEVGDQHEALF